jgi:hypothetical protein
MRSDKSALFRSILAMLVAASACLETACAKRSLNRDQARRLLNVSTGFAQPAYQDVPKSTQPYGTVPLATWNPCTEEANQTGWQPLISLGYTTLQVARDDAFVQCQLKLTASGQRESAQWRSTERVWQVPVGTKLLSEVAVTQDEGSADPQADYTWRWDLTPFGRMLGSDPRVCIWAMDCPWCI